MCDVPHDALAHCREVMTTCIASRPELWFETLGFPLTSRQAPAEEMAFMRGDSDSDNAIDERPLIEVRSCEDCAGFGVELNLVAQNPVLGIGLCSPGTVYAHWWSDEHGKCEMQLRDGVYHAIEWRI